MLTLLCLLLCFSVFGAMIKIAWRMSWGLTKILWRLVLLPVLVLGIIFSGISLLAIPFLIILGIVALRKLLVKV